MVVINETGIVEVEEQSKENEISIYPNPVMHNLTVELQSNENYQLEITNMLGKKVILVDANGSETIVIDKLPKVMYILSITQKGQLLQTEKFIKE